MRSRSREASQLCNHTVFAEPRALPCLTTKPQQEASLQAAGSTCAADSVAVPVPVLAKLQHGGYLAPLS